VHGKLSQLRHLDMQKRTGAMLFVLQIVSASAVVVTDRWASALGGSTSLPIRRAELKRRVVNSATLFRLAQQERWAQEEAEPASTFALGREGDDAVQAERIKSPLAAEGFGNVEIGADQRLDGLKSEVIENMMALTAQNPTPRPLEAWRKGEPCALDGRWDLLFTTGADATFRKTSEQGEATTFTVVDGSKGTITNCVDFSSESAKLQGFRVVVAGYPLSDDELQLKFRRVKLLRRSRIFKKLTVPLPPSWLLRSLSRWASRGKGQLSERGAGFKLLYLDDDLRMHRTFDGQYFVQQRPRATQQKAPLASTQAPTPEDKVGVAQRWVEQALSRSRREQQPDVSSMRLREPTRAFKARAAGQAGDDIFGAPPAGFEWGPLF